jgi:hypothetical protein
MLKINKHNNIMINNKKIDKNIYSTMIVNKINRKPWAAPRPTGRMKKSDRECQVTEILHQGFSSLLNIECAVAVHLKGVEVASVESSGAFWGLSFGTLK